MDVQGAIMAVQIVAPFFLLHLEFFPENYRESIMEIKLCST